MYPSTSCKIYYFCVVEAPLKGIQLTCGSTFAEFGGNPSSDGTILHLAAPFVSNTERPVQLYCAVSVLFS